LSHSSWHRGVCILRKQSEKSADQATRDQERATAATERALAEQTREIAEALERANEVDAQNAYETQMAIERAAEENRRTRAEEWKLQSRSKSDQARKLKDSGMLSDALELALQAIQQDRGNLDGYSVAADVLNEQGQYDPAKVYIEKQIQLLSHSDYRTEPGNFLRALYKIGSDDALRCMVCQAIEGNIEYWDWRGILIDDRAESITKEVSGWKQFKTALVVQRWVLHILGFTPKSLTSIRKLVLTAAGSPAGVGALRKELEELARWISGEDKGDDSSMFQFAEKRRPLAALVLAEEIYALLGTKRRLILEFLQRLKTNNFENNCEKLEGDLGELRKLCTQGEFDADAFPRVQQEVAEKYSVWQQDIQEQVYAKVKAVVDAKPRNTHGCLAGFVAWIVLCLAVTFVPLLLNGTIPRGTNPTTAFGALLGAILFGVASKTIEKYSRYYRTMRDALAEAVTRTNKRFGELGLPAIPAPALKVHPPTLRIVVYAVLLCSYLGLWLYAITPSAAPNEGAIPNQGNVTESQVQPSSNSNANEQRIDIVSTVLPQQMQTITITGVGLGRKPAYLGDSDFLQVSDLTRDWNAGWSRDPGTDKVGLNVTSWTDTKIVIEGFTGAYGTDQNFLREGDNIRFRVWNPQTGHGPAVYTSVVAGAATHMAGGPNEPQRMDRKQNPAVSKKVHRSIL
jgi:tetratricopeptide (TPR) repeat protein